MCPQQAAGAEARRAPKRQQKCGRRVGADDRQKTMAECEKDKQKQNGVPENERQVARKSACDAVSGNRKAPARGSENAAEKEMKVETPGHEKRKRARRNNGKAVKTTSTKKEAMKAWYV